MGRRFATGVVAGLVLMGAGGCSDDGGEDAAAVDGPTTTVAETSTTTTEAPTTEAPTTTTLEELDNAAIQAFMEAEHPDEAALVDWTIFRWVGFNGGYTAHVSEGTTPEVGTAVCEGLSEIVYQYSDHDPIKVVIGVEEVPLVGREGPDGTCAPA